MEIDRSVGGVQSHAREVATAALPAKRALMTKWEIKFTNLDELILDGAKLVSADGAWAKFQGVDGHIVMFSTVNIYSICELREQSVVT